MSFSHPIKITGERDERLYILINGKVDVIKNVLPTCRPPRIIKGLRFGLNFWLGELETIMGPKVGLQNGFS
jgi:hypothetical protein